MFLLCTVRHEGCLRLFKCKRQVTRSLGMQERMSSVATAVGIPRARIVLLVACCALKIYGIKAQSRRVTHPSRNSSTQYQKT